MNNNQSNGFNVNCPNAKAKCHTWFHYFALTADQMKGFGSLKHSEIVQECVNNFCFALFCFFLATIKQKNEKNTVIWLKGLMRRRVVMLPNYYGIKKQQGVLPCLHMNFALFHCHAVKQYFLFHSHAYTLFLFFPFHFPDQSLLIPTEIHYLIITD